MSYAASGYGEAIVYRHEYDRYLTGWPKAVLVTSQPTLGKPRREDDVVVPSSSGTGPGAKGWVWALRTGPGRDQMPGMIDLCRRVSSAPVFQKTVLGLIVLNAVVMGLETWPSLAQRWGSVFHALNGLVQVLFVVEIAMRILAHGRQPLAFFRNGWNVFDFSVVLLSLLPAAGALANIARLARVLRVGRLISNIPELRLIIETMFRSIPSMTHIVLLVGLLIYVYGVIGNHLFGAVDPEHWGSLGKAAQTLFVVITLEGWVELLDASSAATEWAWVYYVSFIVVAVFVVINLFIAVVLNNLEKVRDEMAIEDPASGPADTGRELVRLHARLDELHAALRALAPSGAPVLGALAEREASAQPHAARPRES